MGREHAQSYLGGGGRGGMQKGYIKTSAINHRAAVRLLELQWEGNHCCQMMKMQDITSLKT